MSRPSSAGGGLGAGKAGGGKHGSSGGGVVGAAAAAAAATAAENSVAGSGSVAPSTAVAVTLASAGLPGQPPELTALFECPVCFDYVLPPILQCQSGHLVCNQCRQKLSCCPTCRGPLSPSIRNLAMEKVASTLPFPCKVTHNTAPCHVTGESKQKQTLIWADLQNRSDPSVLLFPLLLLRHRPLHTVCLPQRSRSELGCFSWSHLTVTSPPALLI